MPLVVTPGEKNKTMTMNTRPFETGLKGRSGKVIIGQSATNFRGGGYSNQVPSTPSVVATAVTQRPPRQMMVPEEYYYDNCPQQWEGEKRLLVVAQQDLPSRMVPPYCHQHHATTTELNQSTGGNKANATLSEGNGEYCPTTRTTMTRRDALRTYRPASDSNLRDTPTSSLYCHNNGTTSSILFPPNHGTQSKERRRSSGPSSQGLMNSSTKNVSRRASAPYALVSDPPTTTVATRTTRRYSSSLGTTQPHQMDITERKLAPPPAVDTNPRRMATHDVRRGQEAEGSDWKGASCIHHHPPEMALRAISSTRYTTTANGASRSLNGCTTDINMAKPVRRSSDPISSSNRGPSTVPLPVDGHFHSSGIAPSKNTSCSKSLDVERSRIVHSADKLRIYRWTQNSSTNEDRLSSLNEKTKSNTKDDECHPKKEMKMFKSHRATLSAFYPNIKNSTTNNRNKKYHQQGKQSVTTTTPSKSFLWPLQSKSGKTRK